MNNEVNEGGHASPLVSSLVTHTGYPPELIKYPQWLLYQLTWNEKKGKYNKIPKKVVAGKLVGASKTRKADMLTFSEAESFLKQGLGSGLGFCITEDDPFICLDLDKCSEQSWFQEILSYFNSSAELSVSKTGAHIFIRAEKPDNMGTKSQKFFNSQVEILGNGSFVAMTGLFNGAPVADRQKELLEFAKPLIKNNHDLRLPPLPSTQTTDYLAVIQAIRLSKKHSERFEKLYSGEGLTGDRSADDQSLCNIIATFSQDRNAIDSIIRSSNRYRAKWDALRGTKTYGEMTIDNSLSSTNPHQRRRSAEEAFRGMEVPSPSPVAGTTKKFSFAKFAMNDDIDALKKQMLDEKFILDGLALLGELTVFYAPPNSGKTLITLYLLIDAVKSARIKGEDIFYLNCDDSFNSQVYKAEIVAKHNINMIAPDIRNFKVSEFTSYLKQIISDNNASGVVLILDTLKKFTDLMHKTKTSTFNELARRFVQQGGTIIALAHTNKHKNHEGKSVYAGTSDVIEDFDCAFMINTLHENDEIKTIQFENIKRRGRVSEQLSFSYSNSISEYQALLDSVTLISEDKAKTLEKISNFKDDEIIASKITQEINAGNNKKTNLINTCHKELKHLISRRKLEGFIDSLTGDAYSDGARWSLTIGDKNSHILQIIEPDYPDTQET